MKAFNGLSATQQTILNHARAVIMEMDGKSITRLESLLTRMGASVETKPELAKLLLQVYGEAEQAEHNMKMEILEGALAFKEKWTAKFNEAERLGKPLPKVWPDPRDLIVRGDTVECVGPLTEAAAADLKYLLDRFEVVLQMAQEVIDNVRQGSLSLEEGRKLWKKYQRIYYKVKSYIPERHRKKYPPFKVESLTDNCDAEGDNS